MLWASSPHKLRINRVNYSTYDMLLWPSCITVKALYCLCWGLNSVCLFSFWIRARFPSPLLLPGQMTAMTMSYPGAVSATKMPLCAAMAVTGTSTANAVFGKSHNSSWSERWVTGKLGYFSLFFPLGRKAGSRREDLRNTDLSWMLVIMEILCTISSYRRLQGLNCS